MRIPSCSKASCRSFPPRCHLALLVSIGIIIPGLAAATPTETPEDPVWKEILAHRPKPLTDLPVEKTFSVGDFGAKPDQLDDALPAVQKAIAAALTANKPTAVTFPKGTYHFYLAETGSVSCIQLKGISNLILDGAGSQIILHNPRRGFVRLDDCSAATPSPTRKRGRRMPRRRPFRSQSPIAKMSASPATP